MEVEEPGKPAYQQIADELRSAIAEGRLAIGEPVESTAQLMARHHVSSTVARKAVDQLRIEGLVVGRPGKGVYVRTTPADAAAEAPTLARLAEEIRELRQAVAPSTQDPGAGIEELREDMAALRRQMATLQAHLSELYARVGQPYPHGSADVSDHQRRARRA